MCYIGEENYCQGIQYLVKAIKLEPSNVDNPLQLAMLHEMIEEDEMALMIYQKIIETNPEYIRAYIQKATLYMHQEDYLNSAKMFKTVIKLKPDYYRAYLALGICYDKLNNTVGAKRFYKKYLHLNKLAPNYYDITQRIANLSMEKEPAIELRIV